MSEKFQLTHEPEEIRRDKGQGNEKRIRNHFFVLHFTAKIDTILPVGIWCMEKARGTDGQPVGKKGPPEACCFFGRRNSMSRTVSPLRSNSQYRRQTSHAEVGPTLPGAVP